MNSHTANSVTRREATPQLSPHRALASAGDAAPAATSPEILQPSRPQPRLGALIRRFPLTSFMAWFFTVGQAIVFIPVIARFLYNVHLATAPFLITAARRGYGRCGNGRWPSRLPRAGTPSPSSAYEPDGDQ